MSGQIDWVELFFSSTGRVARTPFLIAAAVLIAIALVYEASMGPTMHLLTGWFIYPGLLFSGACVLSKRLHDRGRSGWLAAIIILALIVVWPIPAGFLDFAFSVVIVWAAVELGVMAGEQGANRYGPNPVKTVTL
ncbi:MAG TPA: DUF805 domain-containing protein [Caulobacter sp.]|nr:DUF805 domain-containing protein [Caulobacter sp.]